MNPRSIVAIVLTVSYCAYAQQRNVIPGLSSADLRAVCSSLIAAQTEEFLATKSSDWRRVEQMYLGLLRINNVDNVAFPVAGVPSITQESALLGLARVYALYDPHTAVTRDDEALFCNEQALVLAEKRVQGLPWIIFDENVCRAHAQIGQLLYKEWLKNKDNGFAPYVHLAKGLEYDGFGAERLEFQSSYDALCSADWHGIPIPWLAKSVMQIHRLIAYLQEPLYEVQRYRNGRVREQLSAVATCQRFFFGTRGRCILTALTIIAAIVVSVSIYRRIHRPIHIVPIPASKVRESLFTVSSRIRDIFIATVG